MVTFKDSDFATAIAYLEQHEIHNDFPAWVIRHQKEVFLLAYRMGIKLGFNAEQLTDLSIAARFHDIGKTHIDPLIINHEGSLSEEQRYAIFEHVHQSHAILRKKGISSKRILDAVFYHHENYDGSGYPDRLSKHEIPIEAQILRIVDSYSAMMGQRPYLNIASKNLQKAAKQIEKGSGELYNPKMVKTFLEMIKPSVLPKQSTQTEFNINGVLFEQISNEN